jgi:hypothetical protein
MKKNKTDQHKSPCKLTACKGFSFSHYSHHLTSQHHTTATPAPAPTPTASTPPTLKHTTPGGTPAASTAARQAAAPTITSGTPARAACAVTKRPRTIPPAR